LEEGKESKGKSRRHKRESKKLRAEIRGQGWGKEEGLGKAER